MVTRLCIRIIFLIFYLLTMSCNGETKVKSLNLDIQEAFEHYENNNLLVIDIRTKKEWIETGIIPKSILVNMHNDNYEENRNFIKEIDNILMVNKENNIVFICASGARSEIVVNYFSEKGYNNISHIPQGIIGKKNDGWLYLGYPLKSLGMD